MKASGDDARDQSGEGRPVGDGGASVGSKSSSSRFIDASERSGKLREEVIAEMWRSERVESQIRAQLRLSDLVRPIQTVGSYIRTTVVFHNHCEETLIVHLALNWREATRWLGTGHFTRCEQSHPWLYLIMQRKGSSHIPVT